MLQSTLWTEGPFPSRERCAPGELLVTRQKPPAESDIEARLAKLVDALRAGDATAANKIVALMETPLLAKLYVKVPPQLVEDVYQETWSRFYRQLEGPEQPNSYVAWFLGIARLVTLEMLRDEKRTLPLPEDAEQRFADPQPSPRRHAQSAQLRAALFHCLGKIPERYSRLLVAHIRGEPREALCEELDLALPNFGKLLYRARQALLKCLAPLSRFH